MSEINGQRLWHLTGWFMFGTTSGAAFIYAQRGDTLMVISLWAVALLSLVLAGFAWIEMEKLAVRDSIDLSGFGGEKRYFAPRED